MSATKFYLSKEEKANLLGRQKMLSYLAMLIEEDTNKVITDIRVRLGIKEDQKVTLDIELGIIQLVEEPKPAIHLDKK